MANSLHGEKNWGNGVTIKAATVGCYPEILEQFTVNVDMKELGHGA